MGSIFPYYKWSSYVLRSIIHDLFITLFHLFLEFVFLINFVGFHFFRKESAFTNLVFSFLADDDGALFFNKKQ